MHINGVNLGNWLVLEKWMSPVVFAGVDAEDETWLVRKLSKEVLAERMRAHRETYITERDFAEIAGHGMNTVRIPVPYFIFGDREPFIGCIEYLDKAFNWAERYHLQILIDLHTAPGSQNGFDNGGLSGVCKWSQMPEEVEFELSVLERLSQRYSDRRALFGIEVINEPVSEELWKLADIPNRYKAADPKEAEGSKWNSQEFIRSYYLEAYKRIRQYLSEEKVIVFHDAFQPMAWKDFFIENQFVNVMLDTHMYLMVAEGMGCKKTPEAYVEFIQQNWEKMIEEIQKDIPVICGEWCLYNVLTFVSNGEDELFDVAGNGGSKEKISDQEKKEIYQKLAAAQLKAWKKGSGYFYWSYKLLLDTVNTPGWIGWDAWDLGKCWSMGWFPEEVL